MKQPSLYGIILPFLLLFSNFSFSQTPTQSNMKPLSINWDSDTVSAAAAAASATKFRSDLNNAGKKATKIVTLPVDKLKDIMDACSANGVSEVKLLIVMIRAEDTAQYSKHNPGMTPAEKKDLIGRQTVILRVPRRAFEPSQSGSRLNIQGKNPLMLSLLATGMVTMDKPIGGIPYGEGDVFFGLGSICPPPTSCDN